MNEGLALGLKTVGVAMGTLAVVLGLLEIVTALQEGRRLLLGLGILAFGLLLVVPIFGLGVREMLAEKRREGR